MSLCRYGMFWEAETVYLELCPGFQNEVFSDCSQSASCKLKLYFFLLVPSSQVWCVGHKGNTFILYDTPLNYNSIFHTSELQ
jgi:hypothetical protein